MLQARIKNKSLEMTGRKINRYHGLQIDIAVCFKHTQYDFYRLKDERKSKATYADLRRHCELLILISNPSIEILEKKWYNE